MADQIERGAVEFGPSGQLRQVPIDAAEEKQLEEDGGIEIPDLPESDSSSGSSSSSDQDSSADKNISSSDESSSDDDDDDPKVSVTDTDEKRKLSTRCTAVAVKNNNSSKTKTIAGDKAKFLATFDPDNPESRMLLKKLLKPSAAIAKHAMNPFLCQHPQNRLVIWKNLQKMLEHPSRGYHLVRDAPDPTDEERLLPQNNRFILNFFHWHAEKAGCEPIYIVFCLQTGHPTLKSLRYPSRHVILISDRLTSGAIKQVEAQETAIVAKYPGLKFPAVVPTTHAPPPKLILPVRKLKKDQIPLDYLPLERKRYEFSEVYVEAFLASDFRKSLMDQRSVAATTSTIATPAEIEEAKRNFDRDITKFPILLSSDPVAKYLGAREGMLIKEQTASSAAGIAHSYRIVMKAREKKK